MTTTQSTSIQISDELSTKVRNQVEYYLSFENLAKDAFLISKMNEDRFVPISLLAQFRKMKELTTNIDDIISSIKTSQKLELDESSENVRPIEWQSITWKFLQVEDATTVFLQEFLGQLEGFDASSVLIIPDLSQQKGEISSLLVRCNDEKTSELLLQKLSDIPTIKARHYIGSDKKQLRPTAKPFVPSFTNSPVINRNGIVFGLNPNMRRISMQRHREKKTSNGNTEVQTNGKPAPKSFQRSQAKSQRRKSVHSNQKDSSNKEADEAHGTNRKRVNKEKSNGQNSQSIPSKSTKNFPQRPQLGKKNEKSKRNTIPAPTLNINNYPSLQSKVSSDGLSQSEIAPVHISPGEFSFAEIASKAKDIAQPRFTTKVQVTTTGNAQDSLKVFEQFRQDKRDRSEKIERSEKSGKKVKSSKSKNNEDGNGKSNKSQKKAQETQSAQLTQSAERKETQPISENTEHSEQHSPVSPSSYAGIASLAATS